MKKTVLLASLIVLTGSVASCGGGAKSVCPDESTPYTVETKEIFVAADSVNGVPEYTILEKTQVDLNAFPKDADNVITIFCGKSLYGWRGYDKDAVPGRWVIDEAESAIKLNGSGGGEAQNLDGGDLIFAHKFKNFELSFEWKVAKSSNSGVFVLAQEIKDEPIYFSSPEYQILDNANHPDATQGENGNRQSASLYDMIPAKPQNARPFGEWNTAKITVFKGSVFHEQNGKTVVEYHLWTPQWKEMLDNCKFSKDKSPLAYYWLLNLGGQAHEGYIGLQDHGDDVWYRNIKVKILD
jgi:hypothetical protein